jgi:hypothetical protein
VIARLLVLGSGALLGACGSLASERPAVIAASPAAHAELERVVTLAMNGVPVLLAADALTRDSVLSVARRAPGGEQGRAATGRTLEEPARLRLVLVGSHCELVREADGQRFALQTPCSPRDVAR